MRLSHTNQEGKAKMVDVGHKPDQRRMASAEGYIRMAAETVRLIRENQINKGDALTVAEVAGIQAAKLTSTLIPLCHPLPITYIEVRSEIVEGGVKVTSEVHCKGKTGVEMEALTAVGVALLTIYDMCKAVDKSMVMEEIRLVKKRKENL